MKYLVTGGFGFIGSHITEYLVNRGDNVVVLDNFNTGKEKIWVSNVPMELQGTNGNLTIKQKILH